MSHRAGLLHNLTSCPKLPLKSQPVCACAVPEERMFSKALWWVSAWPDVRAWPRAQCPPPAPSTARVQSPTRCTMIDSPSLPHPMQLRTPLQSQTRRCPAHCQLLSQRGSSCLPLRAQPAPPAGLHNRRNLAPQITFWAQAAQASLSTASTAGAKQRCIKIHTLSDASPHAGWPHCGPGPRNGGLLCD